MIKDWDKQQKPLVPRHELPCLQHLPEDARFYLTMYLRGAADSDQETAKARCAGYGVDYAVAKAEADRT